MPPFYAKTKEIIMGAISNQAECTVCGADMDLGNDVVENELFECTDCGTEYEVTARSPISVELAPDVEEDWGE
jgi:alpha-aminoadipate/glutamate carrier protein LysW